MSAIIEAMPVERTAAVSSLPQGESCVLVIFGASGDLTRRKLIPALYDLACIGCMNPKFDVLGIGRTRMNSEEFRVRMHGGAASSEETRKFAEAEWVKFEKRLSYIVGDPNDLNCYPRLAAQLEGMRARAAFTSYWRLQHSAAGSLGTRPTFSGEMSAMFRPIIATATSAWPMRH